MKNVLLLLVLGGSIFCPLLSDAADEGHSGGQSLSTEFQWIILGSNVSQITTGMRATHHHWYGEFSLGGLSAQDNRESAFFLGLNLGRKVPLSSRVFLGLDLGYRHVIPDGSDQPTIDTDKFFTLDARLKLEVILGRHMSVFVGGGTTRYGRYSGEADSSTRGSVFWGVGLL